MASMMSNSFAGLGLSLLVGILSGTALAAENLPSVHSPELGHGPYSYMHMLLQKTILKINVATIEVRVDKDVQSRLAVQGRDKSYSEPLADQLTQTILGAKRAVVQMQFARDIPLKRWIGVVHESLEQARAAALLDVRLERRVKEGLPQWFGALKDRGYEKGDRLIYSVSPEGTRSLVVSAKGQVLVDRTDKDPGAHLVVLTSYFAPKSDFREPLLRYLLEKKQ